MDTPRIKVLLLTPWVTRRGGGVAEAVRLLARQLARRPDFDIEVVSVREADGAAALADWGGARIAAFRYHGPGNYRFSPGLLGHLLRSDAQIVHVHGLWTFQCAAVLIWSMVRRRPYVVSPHGMLEDWILARSKLLKGLVSALYQRAFLRRAAALHVLTEREGLEVARFAPAVPRQVVPNFVEPAAEAEGKPAWWRPELARKTVFLFLGRIHVKKGWRELCAAWEQVCGADADFAARAELVFCGWLDGSPEFAARVAGLAARYGNFVFAGPQYGAERQASLAAADALVLASRSEGLPMVVLEAWAAGVPVLMTRACNLPLGFAAGAAIEIGPEAAEVAEGLRRFAGLDAAARQRMAAAGPALVAREFSAAVAEQRFVALYREMAR